ncbi:MAG: CNNM domain-containing protein [Planctomycetota bacterium]
MSTGEIIFWLALAVFGTVDSALWSGLETGLYVVSRLDLRAKLSDRKRSRAAKRLANEIEHPERALATLLVMNNISNYLGALALAKLLSATDLPGWAVTLINVAVLTPLLFIFAETLPKELFRTRADQLMYPLSRVLRGFRIVLTALGIVPAVLLLIAILRRALGEASLPTNPRDRFAGLIQEAEGEGLLSSAQAELLDRSAAFRGVSVGDEMVPWPRVQRLRADASPAECARALRDAAASRLPVTDRRGGVIGYVRIIDLSDAVDAGVAVRESVRPVLRLGQATPVAEALRAIRTAGHPLAIVERAGRPVGIVTIRDLVEPFTGPVEQTAVTAGDSR